MASIMDRDPWFWTVAEVTRFFIDRHARAAMAEMPGVALPPSEHLVGKLRGEGVTGAVLLSEVDHDFLRRHCKIGTLGARAAVMHCIKKLRTISPGYKNQSEATIWSAHKQQIHPIQTEEELLERLMVKLAVPGGHLVQLLASRLAPAPGDMHTPAGGEPMQIDEVQPAATETIVPATTDQARPNESLIEIRDGKKRRRLDLSAAPKVVTTISQAFDANDLSLSLPRRKLPIDAIFFGETKIGKECGALKVNHPLYVHEGSNDKEFDEKNFQYINTNLQLGVAAYVGSRLQRSMYQREEHEILRHERHAMAAYPYRTGLQAERTKEPTQYGRRGRIMFGGTRSTLLVQRRTSVSTGDTDDPDLEDSYIVTRETEAILTSKPDKYGHDPANLSGEHEHLLLRYPQNDDELMSESDTTTEEGSDGKEEDTGTEFGDDQAEEVDDDEAVNATDISDTINNAIESCIARWKENALPKLESKKVWTVWKQMRRSKTIRDQLVYGARTRIEQLQARLSKARREMESTLWEDRAGVEKQCQNLEPTIEDIEHERWRIGVWSRRQEPDHTASRKASHKHAASVPGNTQQHNQLPSLGPQDRLSESPRPPSPLPPPTEPSDHSTEPEREQFHTPKGSPVIQREDSPFVVQDDDDMQIDSPVHTEADGETLNTPNASNRAGLLKTPNTASRFQDTTSADMPSPSELMRRKKAETSRTASVIDITDIRSSAFEPPTPAHMKVSTDKGGKARKRGRAPLHGIDDSNDEVPSISEADQWRYSDLVESEQRDKLLQKLLRDAGQKNRDELWKTYQELKLEKFVNLLMVALDTIVSLHEDTPSEDESNNISRKADNTKIQALKLGARLLLAFYFQDPDIVRKPGPLLVFAHNKAMPKRPDAMSFVHLLRGFLMQRAQPLYSSPMPLPASYNDPIMIDSDDDILYQEDSEDLKQTTTRSAKKRKKIKTESDFRAEGKRKAARVRLEESQQLQSSNPAILQSMVLADSSPGDKIINPLRKVTQEPIFIEKHIAKSMKSYQLEGVQFLWRELTSDPDEAQGCLLAHTMGLGKTIQSIALLRCVDTASQSHSENITSQLPRDLQLGADRNKRSLRFLIICPPSLLQNWRKELDLWSGKGAFGGVLLSIETATANSDFIETLQRWSKGGGILLVGYSIFQRIVQRQAEDVAEEDQSNVRKVAEVKSLNERMDTARRIITEDAELIVADEAHHVKNPKSSTAIAVAKINSNARIALTGTPMSNDVDEIYALISWVSPGFLGDKKHFADYFGVPIKNGLYADSDAREKRKSTIKLKSLHHEIEPKVHRAGISVLKGELKPKVEFVITVELTEQQCSAYARTVAALLGAKDLDVTALTSIFAWLGVLGLLTAHPRCFRRKLLTPVPAKDQAKRLEKANARRQSSSVALARTTEDRATVGGAEAAKSNEGSPEVPGDESVYALGFTENIVNALVEDLTDDVDPTLSAKSRLLQEILRLSKQCNDKVLIFSASIPSLDYLGALLQRDKVRFERIDGSMRMEDRTKVLANFQHERGDLDVLLISTRAGGQGLNIQSANRVIIFDFGFNPSWEEQAIGRAYRFGQKKPVFVYRFVAGGTFESNIYNTQMFKTSLASRVVDKKNPHRNAIRNTKEYLYPPKAVKHEDLSNELEINLDPNVLSKIMEAQIQRGSARDPSIDICTVRTMEVLQAEAEEEPLDPEELKQVEEFSSTWKAMRPGAAAASLSRPMGAPSSTAPVTAGPSSMRNATMPSSTQTPTNPTSTMPQTIASRTVSNTNTTFAARDIRNGDGMPPPGTSVNMGGLPFAEHK